MSDQPIGSRGRQRLLVVVTYGFSVRYLLPTGVLDGLRRVCEPVVGLGWDDPTLEAELLDRGFEVVRVPDARLDHEYRMFRRRIGLVHQRRLATPSSDVERRVRQRAATRQVRMVSDVKRLRDWLLVNAPGGARRTEAKEASEIERGTNVAEFVALLREHRIDAVMSVTPFHDQDGLALWAAASIGTPSLTSVISFDNPTTRGRLVKRSDRILVWNRFNRQELLRAYPDVDAEDVVIIGAPQFDLHHRSDLRMDEGDWRRELGLPADRPIILYGAGPSILVPGEPRLVSLIDDAIDDGRIEGKPFLLVRRHPAELPESWGEVESLRHGIVTDPWAPTLDVHVRWPRDADLARQMSSFAHSAVHVNVCSSMTVDGALFDRPQIGPTFVPGEDGAPPLSVADLYEREHWQPIARSGGLVLADDESSLIAAINDGLRRPGARAAGRHRMLLDVLTFLDGRSAERLVEQVGVFVGVDQVDAG